MKPVSGKRFIKIIEQNGWLLLRIQGSHHIYGKSGSEVRLTIPVHRNQDLKLGLQRHLMKLAGLTESDLG